MEDLSEHRDIDLTLRSGMLFHFRLRDTSFQITLLLPSDFSEFFRWDKLNHKQGVYSCRIRCAMRCRTRIMVAHRRNGGPWIEGGSMSRGGSMPCGRSMPCNIQRRIDVARWIGGSMPCGRWIDAVGVVSMPCGGSTMRKSCESHTHRPALVTKLITVKTQL